MMILKRSLYVTMAMALTACTSVDVKTIQKAANTTATDAAKQFPGPEQSSNRKRVVVSDTYYFGKRADPITKSRNLPPLFDREIPASQAKSVALYQNQRLNLSQLADLIQSEYNVPVRIDSSVYLRSTTLSSSAAASATAGQGAGKSSSPDSVANLANDFEANIAVKWSGPLPALLDRIVARLGIEWEYVDGSLSFYRFRTKTVDFKAPKGDRMQSRDFSVAGSLDSGKQGGGARSNVGVSNGVKLDKYNFYTALARDLNALRSPGAPEVLVNETLGTITLTDTPPNLVRMQTLVEEQRRRLNRHGTIRLDFVRITNHDVDEIGVQLNAIITSVDQTRRLMVSGAANLTNAAAASLTGQLLLPEGKTLPTPSNPGSIGDGIGGLRGSSAVANALMSWASGATNVTYLTRFQNSVPTNVLRGNTEKYVDSVGSSQGQTSTQTTVTQDSVTTGLGLFTIATIGDDNRVQLEYLLDDSSNEFSISKIAGVELKSPNVRRSSLDQQLNLQPGQTIPIAYLQRADGLSASNLSLGASTSQTRKKDVIVVLASVTLE